MNVIFFVDQQWAFGRIHTDLTKHFKVHGIHTEYLDWAKVYSKDEINNIECFCDYWFTTPHGLEGLVGYGVPFEKIIVVAHSKFDLLHLKKLNLVDKVYSFGVVSKWLYREAKSFGFTRLPSVCNIGIETCIFSSEVSKELNSIGYAGTFNKRDEICPGQYNVETEFNLPVKRGYLVEEIANETNSLFKLAMGNISNFSLMPGFYKNVDCIIVSSNHEGACMPLLEAAASGKLILSTPVGHWDRLKESGAFELPFEEKLLKETAIDIIKYYKNNKRQYISKCLQIQDYAKRYDWKFCINDWLKLMWRNK